MHKYVIYPKFSPELHLNAFKTNEYSLEVLNILKYPFKLYIIFRVYHKGTRRWHTKSIQTVSVLYTSYFSVYRS